MVEWYDLNARQQAALLWGLVGLLVLLLKYADIRNSIRDLLLSFFKPVVFLCITGLFIVTAAVSTGAVYVGRCLGAFETLPVVTSIIWCCTSGVSLMIAKIGRSEADITTIRALRKAFTPAAILSIILSFSVMGIWWEISTLPFVTAFGILAAFSSVKEELSGVSRLLNLLFGLWTLAMISRAMFSLINDTNAWISLAESLVYPLLLTVGILPYMYAIAQYDRLRFIVRCPSREITDDEYGDRWPLTVDKAKLCCRHNAVWIEVNGKRFGLNGLAKGFLERHGYTVHELEEIWRPDPEIEGLRVSIGPLIDDGLKLEARNLAES